MEYITFSIQHKYKTTCYDHFSKELRKTYKNCIQYTEMIYMNLDFKSNKLFTIAKIMYANQSVFVHLLHISSQWTDAKQCLMSDAK